MELAFRLYEFCLVINLLAQKIHYLMRSFVTSFGIWKNKRNRIRIYIGVLKLFSPFVVVAKFEFQRVFTIMYFKNIAFRLWGKQYTLLLSPSNCTFYRIYFEWDLRSVDKVSYFKSLTRLRDFFIKSHEICETFETLKTWNLHHKYSVNLFGRSPKGYIFIKIPQF